MNGMCEIMVCGDSGDGIVSGDFAKFGAVWWLPWAKIRSALAKKRLDIGQLSYDLTGLTGRRMRTQQTAATRPEKLTARIMRFQRMSLPLPPPSLSWH